MSLMTATDLEKAYGAQDVFRKVSFSLPPGSRTALVGPNGVGKTTLLRLLLGHEAPDRGRIQRARNLTIGYLPQEMMFSSTRKDDLDDSIWEHCLAALEDLRRMEEQVAELEAAMASDDSSDELLERYGRMQESFERAGGYTYHARIKQVLHGLGFSDEVFDRPLRLLSGGERTRVQLARLLLEEPDLLVLDEPTNHLDIDAVEWLEGCLREWKGGFLIVSHDRYFLDRTVGVILELRPDGIDHYRGNYSAYAQQREERRARWQQEYSAQQAFIQKERDFIQRNIAGQKTRQAQGRRKRLERMLRDDAIQRPERQHSMHISFEDADRSGDLVLESRGLMIGYADSDEHLFTTPDLRLDRGECVALIGPNGAGKTTFVKNVLGELAPLNGTVRLGASLSIGYFAQAHEDLNPSASLFSEIHELRPDWTNQEVRGFLARYLFREDDLEKPIAQLSGGERGRIALAKLVLSGANFLLLDEPTNHLDLISQELLQEALQGFEGTILLVSHDRYLIDALATQLWVITPAQQSLQVHKGNYRTYLEERKKARELAVRKEKKPQEARKKRPPRSNRLSPAELRDLEEHIASMEGQLAQLVQQMQVDGDDHDRLRRLSARYSATQQELEKAMDVWEQAAMDAERA